MAPSQEATAEAQTPNFWGLLNTVVTPIALIVTTTIAVIGLAARQATFTSTAAFLRAVGGELTARRSLMTLAILVLIGVIGSTNGRSAAGIRHALGRPRQWMSWPKALGAFFVLSVTYLAGFASALIGLLMLPNPWWVPATGAAALMLLVRRLPTEYRNWIAGARLETASAALRIAASWRDKNIERSRERREASSLERSRERRQRPEAALPALERESKALDRDADVEKDARAYLTAMSTAYDTAFRRQSRAMDAVMSTLRALTVSALVVAGTYGGVGLVFRASDSLPGLSIARFVGLVGGLVAGYLVASAILSD